MVMIMMIIIIIMMIIMMITRMPPCLLAYLPSLHCPTYSLFFTQISQHLPVYSCQSIDKSPPLFLVFLKGHSWDCQKKHQRWWFCQLTFSDKDSEGQMRPHTWRASLHVSIATCWFRAYSQVLHSCACIESIRVRVHTLYSWVCKHHVFIRAQSCCNASKQVQCWSSFPFAAFNSVSYKLQKHTL